MFSSKNKPSLGHLCDEKTNYSVLIKTLWWAKKKLPPHSYYLTKCLDLIHNKNLFIFLGRTLHEIELKESIRYASGDPVEAWLNRLLCLDASSLPRSITGSPLPASCNLYYVSRDTLFSYHPASEKFLHKIMALYVSSHYKVYRSMRVFLYSCWGNVNFSLMDLYTRLFLQFCIISKYMTLLCSCLTYDVGAIGMGNKSTESCT